jgi:outer membrane protein
MKKDQELMQRGQALIAEFEETRLTKSNEVTQSIISYIQEYNSNAKYDFILTKMGGNMLYSNEGLDITKDVVKGLNAKYSAK